MVNEDLAGRVAEFGLSDLRKLAPIGNLGSENAWYFLDGYLESELPQSIVRAFFQQKDEYGFELTETDSGYGNTHHRYECKELGLIWTCDSSD